MIEELNSNFHVVKFTIVRITLKIHIRSAAVWPHFLCLGTGPEKKTKIFHKDYQGDFI